MNDDNKYRNAPGIALWLLEALSPKFDKYGVTGDYNEQFNYYREEKNTLYAHFWIWFMVLQAYPEYLKNSIHWSYIMFKNYIKTAIRNFAKNKTNTVINITGLSIGMTCCIFILLYVQYELSFDRFHADADKIYRIAWMSGDPQPRTPHPMPQAMVEEFPEVESGVSLSPIWGPGLSIPTFSIRYEDKKFDEKGVWSADTSFFDVFSFKMLKGNPKESMKQPGGIVITEEIAKKYFGKDDPIGKILTVALSPDEDFTVTGVMENIPDNSHFTFDFLISYVTLKANNNSDYYTWRDFGHFNYIKLTDTQFAKALESKIPNWVIDYITVSPKDREQILTGIVKFGLQPMTDIHLYSKMRWELGSNGDIGNIYIFSASALFILLISCINFMNLSTAKSFSRAKEVGMRKVFGALRPQLIKQFLSESLLLSVISFLITLVMLEILLPYFNNIANAKLELNFLTNELLLFGMPIFLVLVSLIAGSYPAFYLSKFRPIKTLKGMTAYKSDSFDFRKILVVVQFSLTIVLLISSSIVSSQINFLRNKKLGYNKEQIMVIPVKEGLRRRQQENGFDSIKNILESNPNIIKAAGISSLPGLNFNQNAISWTQSDDSYNVSELSIDYETFEVLSIEIAEGRNFTREFGTDKQNSYIINETAAKLYNWETAINNEIEWYDDEGTKKGMVVGVVKDFHYKSLHQQIKPLLMYLAPNEHNFILLKLNTENINRTIEFVKDQWRLFDTDHDFEFSFLDDDYNKLYSSEETTKNIFETFSYLTIFLACLGLFGLALYNAEQKTKEIGLRKVLGASNFNILVKMTSEFVKPVLIANLIAWPIAYILMNNWLNNFAFSVEPNIYNFLITSIIALMISILTVSFHAFNASITNPADSLRSE